MADDGAIATHVLAAVARVVPGRPATLKTNFIDDLGFDSLDLFDLTVEIEDRYGIELDDVYALKTVSDVVVKINDLIAAKSQD